MKIEFNFLIMRAMVLTFGIFFIVFSGLSIDNSEIVFKIWLVLGIMFIIWYVYLEELKKEKLK